MTTRRNFIRLSLAALPVLAACRPPDRLAAAFQKPLVVSTWDSGIRANAAAWPILRENGRALDAVEAAARYAEIEKSCCVGLAANPDRDGKVTLDASIMDENANCGGVAFVQRIRHPISVARRLMETTPHVFMVGEGAEQFALDHGFEREPEMLSPEAAQAWKKWLEKSDYKPVVNVENRSLQPQAAPTFLEGGQPNHDTMGTVALDAAGNLSGACTTSGMAFKMRGRVGDSPVIGAGLFVDNEIGAATSSGVGEEVIRICGSHLIIELMRHGRPPEEACREAVSRIVKRNPEKARTFQVGFIALSRQGEVGAFAVQPEFTYAVTNNETNQVLTAASFF
jgi:N4-(beta-N-acetylglucosaminyl)-L-asparaginase